MSSGYVRSFVVVWCGGCSKSVEPCGGALEEVVQLRSLAFFFLGSFRMFFFLGEENNTEMLLPFSLGSSCLVGSSSSKL